MSRPYGLRLAQLESLADEVTDQCVIWPYAIDTRGYPSLCIGGRVRTGHRYVLQRATGENGAGLDARHLCHEKRCVNPAHLQWGTRRQNHHDRRENDSYGKKLSEKEARAVLALKGALSQREIGAMFGISASSVGDIHRGTSWPHIQPVS